MLQQTPNIFKSIFIEDFLRVHAHIVLPVQYIIIEQESLCYKTIVQDYCFDLRKWTHLQSFPIFNA